MSARGSPRSSRRTVDDCTTAADTPNLDSSSSAHCWQRCGAQRTPILLAAPLSSVSRAIIAASMVLPTPTSSAMSRRTGLWRSAIASGTNWYGRGTTDTRPMERKGPAPLRRRNLAASRSRAAPPKSPALSGSGGAYSAGFAAFGSSGA